MGTLMMHVIAEAQPSSSQASMTKHPAMVIILSDAQHGLTQRAGAPLAVLLVVARTWLSIRFALASHLEGVPRRGSPRERRGDAGVNARIGSTNRS